MMPPSSVCVISEIVSVNAATSGDEIGSVVIAVVFVVVVVVVVVVVGTVVVVVIADKSNLPFSAFS